MFDDGDENDFEAMDAAGFRYEADRSSQPEVEGPCVHDAIPGDAKCVWCGAELDASIQAHIAAIAARLDREAA